MKCDQYYLIVCAHEILYQVRLTKQKNILIKLDFEKAFDNVNWEFLLEILHARRFVYYSLIGFMISLKVVGLVFRLMEIKGISLV